MDWNPTKTLAEANLDTLVQKASSPKAALTALEKKITAEVDKVEAHLVALDARVTELPTLLEQADHKVLKVDQVIAKAKAEGRQDLVQAALQRRDKNLAERAALEAELDGIDAAQGEADAWLTKLQDKLVEVQSRIDRTPDPKPGAVAAPEPTAAPEPKAAAPEPKPTASPLAKPATPAAPAAAKPPVPAKPAAAKPAGKADALDDEFAALLKDMDVDLSKVELPKKKNAPAPLPDSDDGIPDLVTVKDDELPEGEELPPLEAPKKGAAKPGAPAAKPAASAAKPAAPAAKAPAPAAPAAKTPAPAAKPGAAAPTAEKKSKAWLWITSGVVVLGGGGAALAHFVFHLF